MTTLNKQIILASISSIFFAIANTLIVIPLAFELDITKSYQTITVLFIILTIVGLIALILYTILKSKGLFKKNHT